MPVRPIRLKASNEEEMLAVLKTVLKVDEEDNLITNTHDYGVFLIPTLLAPTGVMLKDEDGNEYPEKTPLEGYHANLITHNGTIIKALKGITIQVNKPLLKVAGEL